MKNIISEMEHILICLKEHIALSDDEDNLLLNYIINLQQENEKLKDNAIHNDKVVDKARWNEMIYKSRIDKAVKYINKNKKVVSKYEAKDTRLPLDTFMWGVDNLLNILQNERNKGE